MRIALERALFFLGSLLLPLLLTKPARAEAEPVSAALIYEPAEACIGREALSEMVSSRLGRPAFVDSAKAEIVAELTLRRDPGALRWSASLTLRTADGEWLGARELESDADDCALLNDSLALVLALAIDLPREELPPPRETGKSPEKPPPPRALHLQLRPNELVRSARAPWAFSPAAGLVVSAGLLPGVGLGGRLAVAISPPEFWTVELGGTLWKNSSEETRGRTGRFGLMTADIGVCPLQLGSAALRVTGCVMQSVGRISARGHGFSENRDRDRFFYMWGPRLRGALRIAEPLRFRLGIELDVPATRDQFFYVDSSGRRVDVYRVAPLVGVLELGLELRFP